MVGEHRYLLIGGTTKAATTSLFNYLAAHPEVCASSMKETRFLLDREYPLTSARRYDEGIEKYDEFFRHCDGARLRVEATPDYLYSAGTSCRVKECLPNARVLFILREPVSRLMSWYKFARQHDSDISRLTFDQYVELQKAPAPGRKQSMLALEQGRYSVFLRAYLELLGGGRVLVVFYEELSAEPLEVMKEICGFSGLEAGYYNDYDFKVFNRTGVMKNPGVDGLYRKLKYSIRKKTHDKPLLHSLLKTIKSAVEPVYTAANAAEGERISISTSTERFLAEYYRDESGLIEELTGRPVRWRKAGRNG